ncbi:MAG: hypothetical protein LR011_07730, partial [Verrucomicrobia bacterium]|nr:hypothetical protein [Verrucomicrobiota bacterium]
SFPAFGSKVRVALDHQHAVALVHDEADGLLNQRLPGHEAYLQKWVGQERELNFARLRLRIILGESSFHQPRHA